MSWRTVVVLCFVIVVKMAEELCYSGFEVSVWNEGA